MLQTKLGEPERRPRDDAHKIALAGAHGFGSNIASRATRRWRRSECRFVLRRRCRRCRRRRRYRCRLIAIISGGAQFQISGDGGLIDASARLRRQVAGLPSAMTQFV